MFKFMLILVQKLKVIISVFIMLEQYPHFIYLETPRIAPIVLYSGSD